MLIYPDQQWSRVSLKPRVNLSHLCWKYIPKPAIRKSNQKLALVSILVKEVLAGAING